MTRSELLSAIQTAERESEAAARALGMLRRMVESILQINGDIEGATANGEMTRHLPQVEHLITARKKEATTSLFQCTPHCAIQDRRRRMVLHERTQKLRTIYAGPMKWHVLLAVTLLLLINGAHANFSGSDSFGRITGDWGDEVISGSAQFTVRNDRLEFATSSAPEDVATAAWFWNLNFGSYTDDWSVRIDATLGSFSIESDGNTSLGMYVENIHDPSKDFLRVLLMRFGTSGLYFMGDGFANGTNIGTQYVSTESNSAALQLSYASATHVLTAGYDVNGAVSGYLFTPIFSVDIDSTSSSWGMSAIDTFRIRIYAQSVKTQVSSGDMYFDDFYAIPEPSSGVLLLCGLLMLAQRPPPCCRRVAT